MIENRGRGIFLDLFPIFFPYIPWYCKLLRQCVNSSLNYVIFDKLHIVNILQVGHRIDGIR